MPSPTLTLAFQADQNYVDGLVATLGGVMRHLPRTTRVEVFVIDCGIEAGTRQRLADGFAGLFPGHTLEFLALDAGVLARLPFPAGLQHANRSVYARIFLPDLLPGRARAVYLDCDLLVDTDISGLATLPLHGAVVAAAVDEELKLHERAFNSGVMVMDLDAMRASGLTARAVATADAGNTLHGDQTLLNQLLRGQWLPLEPRWNRQVFLLAGFSLHRTEPHSIWHIYMGRKPWHFQRAGARGLVAEYYQLLEHAGWKPTFTPSLQMTSSPSRDWLKQTLAATRRNWTRLRGAAHQAPPQPFLASTARVFAPTRRPRPAVPYVPAPGAGRAEYPLCILVPFGPNPRELARLDDLMDACLCYADHPLHFVIVNDGNDAAAIARLGEVHGVATDVLRNPRAGRGNGWTGGLTVGELDALLWIADHRPCAGVLKLDTDALVINPFATAITELFASDPTIGLAGNFESRNGAGAPRGPGHSMTATLYWRSKRLSHDREHKKLLLSLWGWRRRIRLLINRACANGYPLGDWCQGGAYALSPEFLRRLSADPAFARPLDFIDVDFCEDVLMAVITYCLHLRILYTVGPSRLFASNWKGLPAPPAELAQAGHAIVHSLKDHGDQREDETRAFFAARRQAVAARR